MYLQLPQLPKLLLLTLAANFLLTSAAPLPQDATAVEATNAGAAAVPVQVAPVPPAEVKKPGDVKVTGVNACATANGVAVPVANVKGGATVSCVF